MAAAGGLQTVGEIPFGVPFWFVGADGIQNPDPYLAERVSGSALSVRLAFDSSDPKSKLEYLRVTELGLLGYSTYAGQHGKVGSRSQFSCKRGRLYNAEQDVTVCCHRGTLKLSWEQEAVKFTTVPPAAASPSFKTFTEWFLFHNDPEIAGKIEEMHRVIRNALQDTMVCLLTHKTQIPTVVLRGAELMALQARLVRLLKNTAEIYALHEHNSTTDLLGFQQSVADYLMHTSAVPVHFILPDPFSLSVMRWQQQHETSARRDEIRRMGRRNIALLASQAAAQRQWSDDDSEVVRKYLKGRLYLSKDEQEDLLRELRETTYPAVRPSALDQHLAAVAKAETKNTKWSSQELRQTYAMLEHLYPPKPPMGTHDLKRTEPGPASCSLVDCQIFVRQFMVQQTGGVAPVAITIKHLKQWLLNTGRASLYDLPKKSQLERELKDILDQALGPRSSKGWQGYKLTLGADIVVEGQGHQVPEDVVYAISNTLQRYPKEVQHVADLMAVSARLPHLYTFCGKGPFAIVYENAAADLAEKIKVFGMKQEMRGRIQATKQDLHANAAKRLAYLSEFAAALEPFLSPSKYNLLLQYAPKDANGQAEVKDEGKESRVAKRITTEYVKESPSWIQGTMRSYQLHGLNTMITMYDAGMGMILGDEMGLGKTLQTISFIGYLKTQRGLGGPNLVVCPLSVFGTWTDQVKKWCPQLHVIRFHGSEKSRDQQKEALRQTYDICVTTYETVVAEKDFLRTITFRSVVLDEAHRIKGGDTLVAHAMHSVKGVFKMLLTGTPLQNDLVELYQLLHYLFPDIFDTAEVFSESFAINAVGGGINTDVLTKVHRILQPLMLRRMKKDVELNLPPKVETKILVPLTEMQKFWYKKIVTKEGAKEGGKLNEWAKLMMLMMQLRKVCNHPFLFEEAAPLDGYSLEELVQASGKLLVLDKLVDRLKKRGSKVLIFSQFRIMLDLLEDFCAGKGWRYLRLDGECNQTRREVNMAEFNDPTNTERFIFLMSTRAGGLGLNLVAADTVILYDSDWNPQVDSQAMARAHRIGQTKTVNIFRMVTDGSAEQRLVERAERKMYLDTMVMEQYRRANCHEVAPETVALEEGSHLFDGDPQSLMKDIFFGNESLFEAGNSTITDADIELLVDQSLAPVDVNKDGVAVCRSSSLKQGVKRKLSEYDANEKLAAVNLMDGEVLKRGVIPGEETNVILDDDAVRERQERIVIVAGDAGWRQAPVLKQEIRIPEQPVVKKPKVDPSLRQKHCVICRAHGDPLVACQMCPNSFHDDCVLWDTNRKAMTSKTCPQHNCVTCGDGTSMRGFNYRCAFCPLAWCSDCIPSGYAMVYEEAPFESNAIMWVSCHLCHEQKTTGRRSARDDPYLVRTLADYDDSAIGEILGKKLDTESPGAVYHVKWLHYPASFNVWHLAEDLLKQTPTAAAKIAAFEHKQKQQLLQVESIAREFQEGVLPKF